MSSMQATEDPDAEPTPAYVDQDHLPHCGGLEESITRLLTSVRDRIMMPLRNLVLWFDWMLNQKRKDWFGNLTSHEEDEDDGMRVME